MNKLPLNKRLGREICSTITGLEHLGSESFSEADNPQVQRDKSGHIIPGLANSAVVCDFVILFRPNLKELNHVNKAVLVLFRA